MQCDRCRQQAVIFQPYSGLHLCRNHFLRDFEAKAKRAIRAHGWLSSGDHIAVALSARDGSPALLRFLKNLTGRRRDITLSAVTIDEGIAGRPAPAEAVAVAASLDVPCTVVSYAGEYGSTLDAIVQTAGPARACPICRTLKRSLLEQAARRQGVTRIALGSTLDNEALAVLTGVLTGEPERLICHDTVPEGAIPFIRPFMYLPAPEVALYAQLNACVPVPSACPYGRDTLESDAGAFLSTFTAEHPSARYSLVAFGERVAAAGAAVPGRIPRCGRCGDALVGSGCRRCGILDEVTCHAR